MESRVLSVEERAAIRAYKEYQKRHFPLTQYATINDYWLAHFNESAHYNPDAQRDNESRLHALSGYLDEIKVFSKRLTRAANLRDAHYERFLQFDMLEDDGHKKFRLALMGAAKDAREKVAYWQTQHDLLLDNVFDTLAWNTKHASPMMYVADIRDNDTYEDVVVQNVKPTRKPKLSMAERKRRKRQRQKAKNELDQMALDKFVKEMDLEKQKHADIIRNTHLRSKVLIQMNFDTYEKSLEFIYFDSRTTYGIYEFEWEDAPAPLSVLHTLTRIALREFPKNVPRVQRALLAFSYHTWSIFDETARLEILRVIPELRASNVDILIPLITRYANFYMMKSELSARMEADMLKHVGSMWLIYRYTFYQYVFSVWLDRLDRYTTQKKPEELEFFKTYITKHPLLRSILINPFMTMHSRDRKPTVSEYKEYQELITRYHALREEFYTYFPDFKHIKSRITAICAGCDQQSQFVDLELGYAFCGVGCQERLYDSMHETLEESLAHLDF